MSHGEDLVADAFSKIIVCQKLPHPPSQPLAGYRHIVAPTTHTGMHIPLYDYRMKHKQVSGQLWSQVPESSSLDQALKQIYNCSLQNGRVQLHQSVNSSNYTRTLRTVNQRCVSLYFLFVPPPPPQICTIRKLQIRTQQTPI